MTAFIPLFIILFRIKETRHKRVGGCRKKRSNSGMFFLTTPIEPISKMSFGPISLLVARFKSSTYNSMPEVFDPQTV